MDVTHVDITPMKDASEETLLAFATITFDEEFVVHNIRLVDTGSSVIVAMPNERRHGEYRDIAHPIDQECREAVRRAVITTYNRHVPEDQVIPLEP